MEKLELPKKEIFIIYYLVFLSLIKNYFLLDFYLYFFTFI